MAGVAAQPLLASLPAPDEVYDIITMSSILHHNGITLIESQRALEESVHRRRAEEAEQNRRMDEEARRRRGL